MPRTHRYYMPGHIWHLTHRCHRKQFLLRFKRDRLAWVRWLYEARCRYGLCVLDYKVTSNHVHLIVRDRGKGEIAASMQLLEGCLGKPTTDASIDAARIGRTTTMRRRSRAASTWRAAWCTST